MPKTKKSITLQGGKCPFCGETIFEFISANQTKRFENCRDFWLSLSDGSRMQCSCCETCRKSINKTDIEAFMEAHRDFWVKGLKAAFEKKHSELQQQEKQQLKHYGNLGFVQYALKERDLE